nr:BrnT family toxin [Pseudomonadota bacterium]
MFSWDEAKNQGNQKKHGVSFEAAQRVFEDPLHLSRQDRSEDGEQRWQTLGDVGGVVVLLVAHTWGDTERDGEHIRIISARGATKLERKIYEQTP